MIYQITRVSQAVVKEQAWAKLSTSKGAHYQTKKYLPRKTRQRLQKQSDLTKFYQIVIYFKKEYKIHHLIP